MEAADRAAEAEAPFHLREAEARARWTVASFASRAGQADRADQEAAEAAAYRDQRRAAEEEAAACRDQHRAAAEEAPPDPRRFHRAAAAAVHHRARASLGWGLLQALPLGAAEAEAADRPRQLPEDQTRAAAPRTQEAAAAGHRALRPWAAAADHPQTRGSGERREGLRRCRRTRTGAGSAALAFRASAAARAAWAPCLRPARASPASRRAEPDLGTACAGYSCAVAHTASSIR